jgi:hypothetical protein
VLRTFAVLCLACVVSGCGSDESSGNGASQGGSGGSGGSQAGWQTLITGDWSVGAGSEDYYCVRKTLDSDLVVGAFEAINPLGTHHTVLTVGEPSGEDGLAECDSFMNHRTMVFGSGVGTDPFELPDGVGMRLRKGQQLLLNLHLWNSGTDAISGRSGTRVRSIEPGALEFEADSVLAGTIAVSLPPNQETRTSGHCTITSPGTVFAVQPHMHQLGTHMKVTLRSGETEHVLHDDAYDFGDQTIYPLAPLALAAGDRVEVVCTHDNTTTSPVSWGESSSAEMCHAGIYRYPPSGSAYFFCQD